MPKPSPFKTTFLLKQHFEIKERETDAAPVITEAGDRQSLLLFEAKVHEKDWERLIEELILPADFIKSNVAGKIDVPRSDLRDIHRRIIKRMKIAFGLQIPLFLDTDMVNTEPGMKNPNGKVMHASYQALHIPTFMPQISAGGWEASWTGKTMIRFGAAEFAIGHAAKVTGTEPGKTMVQVDLAAQPSSFAKDGFSFTCQPAGSVVLTYEEQEAAPASAKGKIQLIVQGKLAVKDEPPREAELLNYKNEFEYARIPASFTDKAFSSPAWKPA